MGKEEVYLNWLENERKKDAKATEKKKKDFIKDIKSGLGEQIKLGKQPVEKEDKSVLKKIWDTLGEVF